MIYCIFIIVLSGIDFYLIPVCATFDIQKKCQVKECDRMAENNYCFDTFRVEGHSSNPKKSLF
jgi:hypothetical protein